MKRKIISTLLLFSLFAGFASGQTRRSNVRSKAKKTTVKRKIIRKKIVRKRIIRKKIMTTSSAVTTESGLTYIITKKGAGAQLKEGDNIIVNYTGLLTNGLKFDSSLDRGEPFSFPLGAGRVIQGWDEGFEKLKVGDHATLIIPPSIGYGARGAGGVIPPDATLIFIVEVIGVK
jgi:peptidylprolyl isomerase